MVSIIKSSNLKRNINATSCSDCDLYSAKKGCKISKRNPHEYIVAIEAFKEGKLCDKGHWILNVEKQ